MKKSTFLKLVAALFIYVVSMIWVCSGVVDIHPVMKIFILSFGAGLLLVIYSISEDK
jgi:hypothetical protein